MPPKKTAKAAEAAETAKTAKTAKAATDCLHGLTLGSELGKGDFAKTFNVDLADGKHAAIKKIKLIDNKEDVFNNETEIGTNLGRNHIAPEIHDSWVCTDDDDTQKYGYITMDKMDGIWAKKYPFVRGSVKHQLQLIEELAKMIKDGYIHNDCHLGNIGFVDDNVVVFDFGLTIRRIGCSFITNKNTFLLLLASQLNIVVEQMSMEEKQGTASKRNYMFDLINYIYTNPSNLTIDHVCNAITTKLSLVPKCTFSPPAESSTIDKLKYPAQVQLIKDLKAAFLIEYPSSPSKCDMIHEILFSNRLYEYLNKTYFEYFVGETKNLLYDLIYEIRKGAITMTGIDRWLTGKRFGGGSKSSTKRKKFTNKKRSNSRFRTQYTRA